MRPKQISEALLTLLQHNMPVLLKGPPGVGKTDIVRQVCDKLGYRLIVSHPVVDDPIDYKGLPFVIKDGKSGDKAEFMPIGNLRELINAKERTVFFLDDLGQAPPAVQAAAMQLLLARHINGHHISDKVTFVAATNRKEDKAGVSGILEPVKSRFVTILDVEVNKDDWAVWALDNGMPRELVGFIQFRPELLHKFEPTPDITNTPCPRTVAAVGRLLKVLPNEPEIRREVVKGAAGEGFASELEGFLRVYMDLPDPKKVLENPKQYEKQMQRLDRADQQFALCTAFADLVDRKTVGNLVKLLTYFPPEFGVMTMSMISMSKKRAELQQSPDFVKWLQANKDIVLGN